MNKIYARSFQFVIKIAMRIVKIRIPELISGEGTLSELPNLIKDKGLKKPLIVTDSFLSQVAKAADPIKDGLTEVGCEFALFDGAVPNPTIDCSEEGLKVYNDNGCDSIIALGGGSPMDCAKIIGARSRQFEEKGAPRGRRRGRTVSEDCRYK